MSNGIGPQSGSQPIPIALRAARPARRSDAERNRTRILEATRALVARRGLVAVSMDAIAAAAGVGKGTVFRAFGDKAGLARALVDDDERALQEALLTGPPPLGPDRGADPIDRLRAFVGAYASFLERNVDLLLVADAGVETRFRTGAYRGWADHLRTLLVQTRPDADVDGAVHAVLALLAPELYNQLRTVDGYSSARYLAVTLDAATRLSAEDATRPVSAAPASRRAGARQPPRRR